MISYIGGLLLLGVLTLIFMMFGETSWEDFDIPLLGVFSCIIAALMGILVIGYALLLIDSIVLRWFSYGLYLFVVGIFMALVIISWDGGC